jgi:hypothetical protein
MHFVYVAHQLPSAGRIGSLFQAAGALGIFVGSVVGYLILGPMRDLGHAAYCHTFTEQDIASMMLTLMAPGLLLGVPQGPKPGGANRVCVA